MRSGLKRLWNAVKPPPPVPRRASERVPPTEISRLSQFLHTFMPPPKANSLEQSVSPAVRLMRRKTVLRAASVVALGGAAWGVYAYISSAPSRALTVLQDGMRLTGKDDLKGAEARFTRAVSIWPQLASGYLERGIVRRELNETDGAIEDLERAVSLDSNLSQAHTELGVIYRDRGDLTRAVNEFTLAIQMAPSTDAFYQRGQLYASLGRQAEALADYDAAIHEQTDAPYVYRARAMSLDALGKHDAAEEDRNVATRIEHH
jgi:tetratricopeptide (TPR) repeat protein